MLIFVCDFCWNIYYRFWLFSPGEMSKKSILWFILFRLYCDWAQKLQWFDWLLMHAIENLNKQKVWCVVYRIIWYLTNYLIIFFEGQGGGLPKRMCSNQRHKGKKQCHQDSSSQLHYSKEPWTYWCSITTDLNYQIYDIVFKIDL